MRFRQDDEHVDRGQYGYDCEEPLHPDHATQYLVQGPVALHSGKHDNVGNAQGDAVADAADVDGEQFGCHRPGYGQQADHGSGDVEEE